MVAAFWRVAVGLVTTQQDAGLCGQTPVHASWLNQIEISSVIQKKVVSPNDFASLEQLSETLLAFIDRCYQTARPFSWKYIAADLTELLHRVGEHEQATATHQTDLTTAA